MKPAARDRYRSGLERLRAELLGQAPQRIEPTRKDPTAVGVADEDEQALTEMVQVLASERNKQQSQSLALIDVGSIQNELPSFPRTNDELENDRSGGVPPVVVRGAGASVTGARTRAPVELRERREPGAGGRGAGRRGVRARAAPRGPSRARPRLPRDAGLPVDRR